MRKQWESKADGVGLWFSRWLSWLVSPVTLRLLIDMLPPLPQRPPRLSVSSPTFSLSVCLSLSPTLYSPPELGISQHPDPSIALSLSFSLLLSIPRQNSHSHFSLADCCHCLSNSRNKTQLYMAPFYLEKQKQLLLCDLTAAITH